MFNLKSTKIITRAAVTAALYVVLTLLTLPIAGGAIQIRIGEGLVALCYFFPECAVGLTIGCVISNVMATGALYDIIFGSLITLLASFITALIGYKVKKTGLKLFLGGLAPVLMNALLLPVIWYYCYGELTYLYIVEVCFLLISQSFSIYGVGTAIYFGMDGLSKKSPFFAKTYDDCAVKTGNADAGDEGDNNGKPLL